MSLSQRERESLDGMDIWMSSSRAVATRYQSRVRQNGEVSESEGGLFEALYRTADTNTREGRESIYIELIEKE